MDNILKELSCLQELDSIWRSKLIVDIRTPQQLILHDIETSIDLKKNSIQVISVSSDIILFLTEPSYVNQLIMKDELNYPKGSSFCFEGYTGVDDLTKLKNYLIDCASRTDGTQIIVVIHNEFINEPKS